jgi:hypothetical protein
MKFFLLTVGVVAVLVAGCGSSASTEPAAEPLTKFEYQQAITKILMSSDRATQLFSDVVYEDGPECAAEARELHGEIERMVDEAAGLTPPDDVAALHEEFVAEARISADAVGEAAESAENGDLGCGDEMNSVIYGLPSTERAERALMQIQDKGYNIFFE